MRKIVSLFAATLFAAMAMLATPNQAEARRYHRGYGGGGAVAALVIGGIAIAALSHRRHHRYYDSYYDNDYGYDYAPRRSYYSSYSYPSYGYGGYGGYGGHRGHNRGAFGLNSGSYGHHRGHW